MTIHWRFNSVFTTSNLERACFGFDCYLITLSTRKGRKWEMMKDQLKMSNLKKAIQKRKEFGRKDATDCGVEPYRLLSPNIG